MMVIMEKPISELTTDELLYELASYGTNLWYDIPPAGNEGKQRRRHLLVALFSLKSEEIADQLTEELKASYYIELLDFSNPFEGTPEEESFRAAVNNGLANIGVEFLSNSVFNNPTLLKKILPQLDDLQSLFAQLWACNEFGYPWGQILQVLEEIKGSEFIFEQLVRLFNDSPEARVRSDDMQTFLNKMFVGLSDDFFREQSNAITSSGLLLYFDIKAEPSLREKALIVFNGSNFDDLFELSRKATLVFNDVVGLLRLTLRTDFSLMFTEPDDLTNLEKRLGESLTLFNSLQENTNVDGNSIDLVIANIFSIKYLHLFVGEIISLRMLAELAYRWLAKSKLENPDVHLLIEALGEESVRSIFEAAISSNVDTRSISEEFLSYRAGIAANKSVIESALNGIHVTRHTLPNGDVVAAKSFVPDVGGTPQPPSLN